MGIAWAESLTIVVATEIAVEQSWLKLWIESDSSFTVEAFNLNTPPWKLRSRWTKCIRLLSSIRVSYVEREVSDRNVSDILADRAANYGRDLQSNVWVSEKGRPQWMDRWEEPNEEYSKIV